MSLHVEMMDSALNSSSLIVVLMCFPLEVVINATPQSVRSVAFFFYGKVFKLFEKDVSEVSVRVKLYVALSVIVVPNIAV